MNRHNSSRGTEVQEFVKQVYHRWMIGRSEEINKINREAYFCTISIQVEIAVQWIFSINPFLIHHGTEKMYSEHAV